MPLLPSAQDHRGHIVPPRPDSSEREGTGCTVKWAIELAEFGLRFALCHAIKSQALTDFIVEWTPVPGPKPVEETATPTHDGDKPWTLEHWCMNFDGSLTLQ